MQSTETDAEFQGKTQEIVVITQACINRRMINVNFYDMQARTPIGLP